MARKNPFLPQTQLLESRVDWYHKELRKKFDIYQKFIPENEVEALLSTGIALRDDSISERFNSVHFISEMYRTLNSPFHCVCF
jgi:hypothetical protein